MNVCENPDILRVIWFAREIVNIVKIIIPIALIVLGIVDFSKAVITSDENVQKKTGKLFMKRIIYAILVFTVPWIIEVLIITLGNLAVLDSDEVNYTDCLENANGDKIAELDKEIENEGNGLFCWRCPSNNGLYFWGTSAKGECHSGWQKSFNIKTKEDCGEKKCYLCTANGNKYWGINIPSSNSGLDCPNNVWANTNFSYNECNNNIEKELNEKEDESLINNKVQNSTDKTGIIIGRRYTDLTDAQLRGIARLCQQEQGSAKGAAAEAELMANQFELDLYGKGRSKCGDGGNGLYNYVAYSGWFSNSTKYMGIVVDKNGKTVQSEKEAEKMLNELRDDVYDAVHEVLVLGKRKSPFYINEHDCIKCWGDRFDIEKIVFNGTIITDEDGLLDRNNYKEDLTKIYNRYGSEYTFYYFPTETSDPFGYTADAKKKYESLIK